MWRLHAQTRGGNTEKLGKGSDTQGRVKALLKQENEAHFQVYAFFLFLSSVGDVK